MTSQARATELTKLNIHAIFGEKDASKRLQTIAEIWAASEEAFFVDSLGVFKTHEQISAMVDKIQGFGGPEDEFVELSEVECLRHDEQDDVWVTRLRWDVGPKGVAPRMTGWNVCTIVGGKIKACYTFLDPQ